MTLPAPVDQVVAALAATLADGRARTPAELVDALQRDGLDLGRAPQRTVTGLLDSDDVGLVLRVDATRYVSLPALLAGRVFTHRVTAVEVEKGFLSTAPDLEALSMLTEELEQLTDGTPLRELLPDFDDDELLRHGIQDGDVEGAAWLVGPEVFTRLGLEAGDVVGVTTQPDGFAIERVSPEPPGALLVAALQAWHARLAEAPEQIDTLVWQVCADDAGAFLAPVPPMGELLTQAGLAWEGEHVMPAGFDLGAHRTERRIQHLAQTYELDDDEALAVLALATVHQQVAGLVQQLADEASGASVDEQPGGRQEQPGGHAPAPDPLPAEDEEHRTVIAALLPLLAEPAVAEALLGETLGPERHGAAALGVFAESLEPLAPRAARPALRWLRGKAHDRLGYPLEAEAAYESVLELDPSHRLALIDLAQVASERGDAERGLSLLRRAGVGADDGLVQLLEHFRPLARADVGRNDRCWCGSGRKYKVCHRNREQLPLEERAAWLYQKAGAFVQVGPWRGDLAGAAMVRSAHWEHDGALLDALQDPLVADVVMFEGGAFEEFLAERGVLLPDDEQLLAAQWVVCERSLFEIQEVEVGAGFTARDLRTGDVVRVRERLGSRQLSAGMLICARLVPAGDTVQCFGGIEPVAPYLRDHLLHVLDERPSAPELLAVLSARFAPPRVTNTEGEPLMLCETRLRSPDPDALGVALDDAYRSGPGGRWHEYVTTHGMERVRATITLEGADVTVETNSAARQDRVLAVLRQLQPDVEVVSDARQPAADPRELLSRAPASPAGSPPLDPSDPAVAAALAQVVASFESAWLDDHIPALGGVTPREAAVDPTRREDLIRLIDSFPPASPGTMDPDRLRAALGL